MEVNHMALNNVRILTNSCFFRFWELFSMCKMLWLINILSCGINPIVGRGYWVVLSFFIA
jgi:hypothetical protein